MIGKTHHLDDTALWRSSPCALEASNTNWCSHKNHMAVPCQLGSPLDQRDTPCVETGFNIWRITLVIHVTHHASTLGLLAWCHRLPYESAYSLQPEEPLGGVAACTVGSATGCICTGAMVRNMVRQREWQ